MKGRTIIELIDEKTGEREVIADNNMIGPAVQELLNVYTKWQGSPNLHRQLNPLYATMFGGILLFENAIDESETQVPAGNKIIGAGSYKFTDQLSNVNGDYNQVESEVTDTYAKHVWDFKTNQANGRISSICLCDSNYTKYFMYGSDYFTDISKRITRGYFESTSSFALFPFNQATSTGGSSSSDQVPFEFADFQECSLAKDYPLKVYIEDDLTGFVTANFETETTIVFKKMKLTHNEMNLLGVTKNYGGCMPVAKEIESKTFTLPSTVKGKYAGLSYDVQNQTAHVAYGMTNENWLQNNSSVTIVSFDLSNPALTNATMTQKTFINKTGETLKIGSNFSQTTIPFNSGRSTSSSPKNSFHIIGNFIYTVGNQCLYKINLADNTEIIKIETKGISLSSQTGFTFDLNGLLYLSVFSQWTDALNYFVIDTISNTAKVTNQVSSFFSPFGYGGVRTFTTKTKQLITGNSYIATGGCYPTYLAMTRNYLSTINNLAQPVTKTNDKSMKVTYILEVDNG